MARVVKCAKLKKEAEGLDYPPYPGPLGLKIFENVSKEAWVGWLEHQTMLVNENRLSLVDPKARNILQSKRKLIFLVMGQIWLKVMSLQKLKNKIKKVLFLFL